MSQQSLNNVNAAIILCGGRSRRMGADKASLAFGNETLLGRACRISGAAADRLIVVAAEGQQLPYLPEGVAVVYDDYPNSGPMGGTLCGLRFLRSTMKPTEFREATVWVSSCDTPFITARIIRQLNVRLGESKAICVEEHARRHPLNAVYRAGCLDEIENLFASGERRMTALLQSLQAKAICASEINEVTAEDFLFNVNTPDALKRAIERLNSRPDNIDSE